MRQLSQFITLFFVFTICTFSLFATGPEKPANKVMVVAHRGDWRNHPENSINGFLSAAKMGVDVIELDLALTKDSVLVIMHDNTIDRTTNGKGKPGEFTLQEIKKFRLRNGLGRVTANEIPTFKEVMTALKGMQVKVNLDKSYPFFREAYAVLKETGTISQAIFKAGVTYSDLVTKYGRFADSVLFMPIVELDRPNAASIIKEYLAGMKPFAFELNFQKDTSAILGDNQFIRQRSKVWINSLWPSLNAGHDDDKAVEESNIQDSWQWILDRGATLIQTDRPKELLAFLRKKGLHA